MVVDADQIAVSGFKGHGHTEIPDIFLDKRSRSVVGF